MKKLIVIALICLISGIANANSIEGEIYNLRKAEEDRTRSINSTNSYDTLQAQIDRLNNAGKD